MAYTIYKTNGQFLTTVADGTINRGSTSIALPGRNFSGYGLYIDQDLVQMVENFAGNTVPTNAIIGQLWWDTSVPGGIMRICLADGDTNPATWGELALGGVGANSSFGNVNTENLYAATANITDLNVANTISAVENIFAGSNGSGGGNISLYGSNGTISASNLNLGNTLAVPLITPNPADGQGTINGAWTFLGGPFTFGTGNSNANTIFNGEVVGNFNLTSTNGNTILRSLTVTRDLAVNNSTAVFSNTNTTFTGGNLTANLTNVVLGTAQSTDGSVGNLRIYGNPVGNILGTLGVTGVDARALTTSDGAGTLQWRNFASYSISNSTTAVSCSPTAVTITAQNVLAANITSTQITANLPFQTNKNITQTAGTTALQNTTVTGNLDVTTNTSITGRLVVAGFANIGGTLRVDGTITSNNDIIAYGGSDSRIKENIRPIANALSDLDKISGVRYDWSNEYIEKKKLESVLINKSDVGVIAQEIEQVLPELVIERTDGYKAVRYEKIIAFLIQAVKELKTEVQDLKQEVQELKDQ